MLKQSFQKDMQLFLPSMILLQDLINDCVEPLCDVGEDCAVERFLGLEMIKDRLLRQSEFGGNVCKRGAVKPAIGKQPQRCADELLLRRIGLQGHGDILSLD